jgi:hypothetical protein
MLDGIRYYWSAFVNSEVFPWIVVVLAVAVYCNLGWALGYVLSNPESVPHWLRFLAEPFRMVTDANVGYSTTEQFLCVIFGPIAWFFEWIAYVVALCFGGIAKLLIMP